MNIEKIKAMSHSEINQLCATKIMGWEIIREYFPDKSFYKIYYEGEKRLGNVDSYEWTPTKYIEDAMRLVDVLDDRLFSIYANPKKSSEKRFTIHVSKNSMAMNTVEIDLDQLPLAISYAALLSIGE